MSGLGKDEITILQAVFNKYDTDKTGCLTVYQFTCLLAGLSKHVGELKGADDQEIDAVFSYLDKDADGKLSFIEFEIWWTKQNKYDLFCGEKAQLLRKAYQLFSNYTKDSMRLSHSGFNKMMKEIGFPKCNDMCFGDLDLDDDGKLSFEEFCEWLNWF
jgi:Ca2+-binding EF-hand superfamily protein